MESSSKGDWCRWNLMLADYIGLSSPSVWVTSKLLRDYGVASCILTYCKFSCFLNKKLRQLRSLIMKIGGKPFTSASMGYGGTCSSCWTARMNAVKSSCIRLGKQNAVRGLSWGLYLRNIFPYTALVGASFLINDKNPDSCTLPYPLSELDQLNLNIFHNVWQLLKRSKKKEFWKKTSKTLLN